MTCVVYGQNGWRDSQTNGPGNWQFLHGVLGVIKLRSELLGLFPDRTNRGEVDSTGILAQSFRKALTATESSISDERKDGSE